MRIALVTPWFGEELIGGAERQAFDLSQALMRNGAKVEVLTTCCRSFHDDWSANYHRPGTTTVGSVLVRRFRVDPRDRVAFAHANSALLSVPRRALRRDLPPLPYDKGAAFVTESIRSRSLGNYVKSQGKSYDAFIFIPYLYGTTLENVARVSDRAFMIPCLHDEAYAYLDEVRSAFRSACGILFNSEGERGVAASLFGPWIYERSVVTGQSVGVAAVSRDPEPIRGFEPHRSRYVLFLGRGDRTKNLPLAVEAFKRFRQRRRATALQLVVAGPHARDLLQGDGVLDLGAVTEEAKAALLQYARALIQPSVNESFSRTVYEAWQLRRPVVVHADCPATAQAVEASGGGWMARTVEDWADVFAEIDESSDILIDGLGMRGRAAAIAVGTWDDVAVRTLAAIEQRLRERKNRQIANIVPLEQWSGPRSPDPRYDDGAINVALIAALDDSAVEALIEIVALLRKRGREVRLFVPRELCEASAAQALEKLADVIGLRDSLVFLGDDINARYAALRDAHVACAFGLPLQQTDKVLQALWFDLPLVAFGDDISRDIIEPCGIICERGDSLSAAAALYLVATDGDLRMKILSEQWRARSRKMPVMPVPRE